MDRSTTTRWDDATARALLRKLFETAIASADPLEVLAAHLPPKPAGRCRVVGAGKAAGSMAAAVEAAWPDVPLSGVVVVPYGCGAPTRRITVREAAHPVPDANSVAAAQEILDSVSGLGPDDLVLALISGGGSSVMALPASGITLADKQTTNRVLLQSGLDIRTMNAVRKRLSAIKGGRLAAAAAPAQVFTLAISDIPGDEPAAIASGPTLPDEDANLDLTTVIARLEPLLPAAVTQRLRAPSPPAWGGNSSGFRLIATPGAALTAAAECARNAGLVVMNLGDDLEGEAREVGAAMARHARDPRREPRVILSGGETTVTITGGRAGRGGRNSEFLLALGEALAGSAGVWALAGDTDGEDGASGGAAGALLAPDSLSRARLLGRDAVAHLDAHDSGGFFDALGDLITTGPTRTNVNDFRAILIIPDDRLG
jgi:hydroxypyruvate reductase